MTFLSRFSRASALGWAFFSLFSACDPIPTKNLTPDQKLADMVWLYSQFDENYAPLEYKMERYGFDYRELKKNYLEAALGTKSNSEFYLIMQKFVAEFKDAHTRASFSHGGLPNRAVVAYLGFSGKRQDNVYVVTEILPTFDMARSSFPVQVGDEISTMDGTDLSDLIRNELVPFENLGSDEANLTYHMNRLFNRVSTSAIFPSDADGNAKDEAHLVITKRKMSAEECKEYEERSGTPCRANQKKAVKIQVSVPWIYRDLFEFSMEQANAKKKPAEKSEGNNKTAQFLGLFWLKSAEGKDPLTLALRGFDGRIQSPFDAVKELVQNGRVNKFLDSFFVPNQVDTWTTDLKLDKYGDLSDEMTKAVSVLKRNRYVPLNAHFITSEDAVFPTYITEEDLTDAEGKQGYGKKLVATMYLNTFSPSKSTAEAIKEFKSTLANLQFYRVKDLVIDMINNGGGSLSLGMEMAQALSNKKVVMPSIQFRISETWLKEFEIESLMAPSDSEKQLAAEMYHLLATEYEGGKRISSAVSAESLIPFVLKPNSDIRKEFNVVLLVNEMCASMCDIFTAILKDNHMATVVGTKTMGAGGNVVSHYQAPNSHMVIRQTESLIVRSDASHSYIENNGIEPDAYYNVSRDSRTQYRNVRKKAVSLLTQVKRKALSAMLIDEREAITARLH